MKLGFDPASITDESIHSEIYYMCTKKSVSARIYSAPSIPSALNPRKDVHAVAVHKESTVGLEIDTERSPNN